MRTTILAVSVLAALALGACGKNEQTATSQSPAPESTAPSSVASSGKAIGIAECDDFLAKYEACLTGKVPESARPMLMQSLEATRNGWRQAMDAPGGRDGLKAACEQARTASRPSLQAYGCTDF